MISPRYARACETVREMGRKAAREGKPESACPYHDIRKLDGRLTYSRHWRHTWFEGYRRELARLT